MAEAVAAAAGVAGAGFPRHPTRRKRRHAEALLPQRPQRIGELVAELETITLALREVGRDCDHSLSRRGTSQRQCAAQPLT